MRHQPEGTENRSDVMRLDTALPYSTKFSTACYKKFRTGLVSNLNFSLPALEYPLVEISRIIKTIGIFFADTVNYHYYLA